MEFRERFRASRDGGVRGEMAFFVAEDSRFWSCCGRGGGGSGEKENAEEFTLDVDASGVPSTNAESGKVDTDAG